MHTIDILTLLASDFCSDHDFRQIGLRLLKCFLFLTQHYFLRLSPEEKSI
jgi:hypothetical protein